MRPDPAPPGAVTPGTTPKKTVPLKAVLFDLDNTFILFDETRFFSEYMPRLARHFTDLIPVEYFRNRIISSTQALIANDGTAPNLTVFMHTFTQDLDADLSDIQDRFTHFYETEFDTFRSLVEPVERCADIVMDIQGMGMKIAVASNPVWPRFVQEKRLAWAGLENVRFDWITDIENTSSCKPHLSYYKHICGHLGLTPGVCMMVGNDPANDMAAGRLGMKTFLTTDGATSDPASLALSREIQNENNPEICSPDYIGSLADLPETVKKLIG